MTKIIDTIGLLGSIMVGVSLFPQTIKTIKTINKYLSATPSKNSPYVPKEIRGIDPYSIDQLAQIATNENFVPMLV